MDYDEALSSWAGLNNTLRSATEDECLALLAREKAKGRRTRILLRIHGRYNLLRAERERVEILITPKKGK